MLVFRVNLSLAVLIEVVLIKRKACILWDFVICLVRKQLFSIFSKNPVPNLSLDILIKYILIKNKRVHLVWKQEKSETTYQVHAFFTSNTFISNTRLKYGWSYKLFLNYWHLRINYCTERQYWSQIEFKHTFEG